MRRTLKPIIDEQFRDDPSRDATGILGSSMGGLISLHAFFAHSGAEQLVPQLHKALAQSI